MSPFEIRATVRHFLVLEWVGEWVVPDHYHGGIYGGPYLSEDEARAALDKYIAEEVARVREPVPYLNFTPAEIEARCLETEARMYARHCILPVNWPALPAPDC